MNDLNLRRLGATLAALAFIACIVGANYLTSTYGFITILGVGATAGTLLAGATFVLRDSVQDWAGNWWVVALIGIGIAVSFAVSDPRIALASAAAFGVAELVDFIIYTPLRDKGYVRAATASNVAGSFVDTVVFLAVAGFPIWSAVPGQMIGKLAVTAVTIAGVMVARLVLRANRTTAVA